MAASPSKTPTPQPPTLLPTRFASATGWHEAKVISQRLGHANVAITLDIHSHEVVFENEPDEVREHLERRSADAAVDGAEQAW